MEVKTCAKCGTPIDPVAAANNGKKYCSVACRRSAEHEIRRVNALLGKLEERASNARLGYGVSGADAVAKLDAEIARHETRLRALLVDQGEE